MGGFGHFQNLAGAAAPTRLYLGPPLSENGTKLTAAMETPNTHMNQILRNHVKSMVLEESIFPLRI